MLVTSQKSKPLEDLPCHPQLSHPRCSEQALSNQPRVHIPLPVQHPSRQGLETSHPSPPPPATSQHSGHPQGLLHRMIESKNIGKSRSGCASNMCPMIDMLVVIPRTIFRTNVLNYLFPGTSSWEWPVEAFPKVLPT